MRLRLKQQRLVEHLAGSSLSQNHWALRIGLSRGHWSAIVNGKHPYPSPKTRLRMLEALALPLEELFEIEAGMVALVTFGAIALLLAGIGIYGVTSYGVASRHHEIGVRLALGATSREVQWHFLRGATLVALTGAGAGLAASLLATSALQSVLYGVTRFDPAAYLAGGATLVGITLLGAYLPARRSSRVDPKVVMRDEP